jgi:hypothetical protein
MLAWLWTAAVLGGLAQAAPRPPKLQERREMVRGLLATLDDRDSAVVAQALDVLINNNAS